MLEDKRNVDNRFKQLEGILKGKYVMDMLDGDFELLNNLKVIFRNLPQPSYERYTNLYEILMTRQGETRITRNM
jgi:hypothetical protein